jgi:DNA-directed RNA polymerase subunit RPC12/RpoP
MKKELQEVEGDATAYSWDCPECEEYNNTSDGKIFWNDTTPEVTCDECKARFIFKFPY